MGKGVPNATHTGSGVIALCNQTICYEALRPLTDIRP